MGGRLAYLGVALLALACGARTSLGTSGVATLDSGACSTWTEQRGPVVLSPPSTLADAESIMGMFSEGDRVFLVTERVTPSYVLVLSGDLSSIGSWQPLFTDAVFGGATSGFGHRGAIGTKLDGCVFATLADDGSPLATSTIAGHEACYMLVATPSGYASIATIFGSPGELTLLLLDATGAVVAQTPITTAGSAKGLWRFDDGSLLVSWSDPQGTWVRHLTADGAPLAPAQSVPLTAAITTRGSSVVLVVAQGTVTSQLLDEDGVAGPNAGLLDSKEIAIAATVGATAHGALAAWFAHATNEEDLIVQPLTENGAPLGKSLLFGDGAQLDARVAATSSGAVIAYTRPNWSDPYEEHFELVAHALCGP